MRPDAAGLLLLGTAGTGTLTWLLALWGFLRICRTCPGERAERAPDGRVRLLSAQTTMSDASRADILAGLQRTFASVGCARDGTALKVEPAGNPGLLVSNPAQAGFISGRAFSCCQVEVRDAEGGGCNILIETDHAGLHRRAVGWFGALLAVGLAVLLVVLLLLWLVAPGMQRAAGFAQFLGCVLLAALVAPWVVFVLYRRARRGTEIFISSAIANASAMAAAFAAKRAKASRPS